jgi:hypothetical protein
MKEGFRVTYCVDDGYAGADRPIDFTIRECDIEEDMTDYDLERLLEYEVQRDFESRISPYTEDHNEFIAWARGVLNARSSE